MSSAVDAFGLFVGFWMAVFGTYIRFMFAMLYSADEARVTIGFAWFGAGIALMFLNTGVFHDSAALDANFRFLGYLVITVLSVYGAGKTMDYLYIAEHGT